MIFHEFSQIKRRQEIFNEEKEKIEDTKETAEALNVLLGRSLLKRKQYIEFLIQLAFVDGGVSSDEDKILCIIEKILYICLYKLK